MENTCPFCGAEVIAVKEDFHSGGIEVKDVEWYKCSSAECKHSWLPVEQERRIDAALEERYNGNEVKS